MTIITVTGYKGGIGKSTTAFHLAAYFSDLGKTVLIDGDPNRTAIKWAGRNEAPLPFTVAAAGHDPYRHNYRGPKR